MVYVIIGFIVLLVGTFGLAGSLKMKTKGMITGSFLPREDCMRCPDKDALIAFLFPRQTAFSALCMAFGIITMLNGQYEFLSGGLDTIMAVVLVLVTIKFCATVRKAIREYLRA